LRSDLALPCKLPREAVISTTADLLSIGKTPQASVSSNNREFRGGRDRARDRLCGASGHLRQLRATYSARPRPMERGWVDFQGFHHHGTLALAVPNGVLQPPEPRQLRAGQRYQHQPELEFVDLWANQQHFG